MNDNVYKRFKNLCEVFQQSPSVSNQQCRPSPTGSPFDAISLRGLIEGSVKAMPTRYISYGKDLLDKIGAVTESLKEAYYRSVWEGESEIWARGYAKLQADTAVGAVVDWKQSELRPDLQYFAAVAADLFDSSVRKKKEKAKSLNPDLKITCTKLPPLVTFAPTPGWGPTTLTSDALKKLGGPKRSVASLPLGYKDDPIMWGILAHEVCGHDSVHAIVGLMEELKEKIKLEKESHGDPLDASWSNLWRAWAEETVADVFGVLSLGPYYAIGLSAWLSASAALDPESGVLLGKLRNRLNMSGRKILDGHPVDLLRLHLLIGVVESLGEERISVSSGKPEPEPGLQKADRDVWVNKLEAIAESAAEGVSTIDVYQDGRSIVLQYPLKQWKQEARSIGQYIATVPLKTLGNHSIQHLETWSMKDECRVSKIIENEDFSPKKNDDDDTAHLIAAAFGVLFKGKTKYGSVTCKLHKAFGEKYGKHPLG